MFIYVIGECDTRPVVYSLMKTCQALGDVLLVSNNPQLNRLSDTNDSFGHYQNCMITTTQEGIDDFLDNFPYRLEDFEFSIIDNVSIPEPDITIYAKGLGESETLKMQLEVIEDYSTIEVFGKCYDSGTSMRMEQFEALRNMPVVNTKIITAIVKILAPKLKVSEKNLQKVALQSASYVNKPKRKLFGGK